jgi:heat shock protein HslJ
MRRYLSIVSLMASLVVLASACSSAANRSTPMTDPGSQLPRYHWALQKAEGPTGQPLTALQPPGHPALELRFQDNRIRVLNACNVIAGRYTIDNGQLQVDQLLHTMMACADPNVNRLEKAATHVLHGPLRMSLVATAAGPRLQLTTTDGEVLQFLGTPADAATAPDH